MKIYRSIMQKMYRQRSKSSNLYICAYVYIHKPKHLYVGIIKKKKIMNVYMCVYVCVHTGVSVCMSICILNMVHKYLCIHLEICNLLTLIFFFTHSLSLSLS